jgi:hypothetical protein
MSVYWVRYRYFRQLFIIFYVNFFISGAQFTKNKDLAPDPQEKNTVSFYDLSRTCNLELLQAPILNL